MEMNSIEFLSSICRICLQDGATYPIFDESKVDQNIHSQLEKCFMEKIEDLEGYPRSICPSCKISLDLLCEYIDKYRASCEIFREALVKVKTEVDDSFIENYDNFIWNDQEYVVIKVENGTEKENICNSSEVIEKLKPLPGLNITKLESRKCLKQKESKTTITKTKNSELASSCLVEGESECNGGEWWRLPKTCKLEENPHKKRAKPKVQKNVDIQEKQNTNDYCGAVFDKKDDLQNHIEIPHTMNAPVICSLCSKAYPTEQHLKQHNLRYHGEKKLQCDKCFKMFTQRELLNKHIKQVHREFPTNTKLVDIEKKQNKPSKQKTENSSVICDYCRAVFDKKDTLQNHIDIRHIMNAPVICILCSKAFPTEERLKEHTFRYHGEKKFQCQQCFKMFTQRGLLNSHIKKTHKKFPKKSYSYSCKFCNKTFKAKLCATIHERSVHTGFRPAVCEVCGKAFYDFIYLREHLRLHTGELPFKCPFCDRGCTQLGNLKSHLRQHKMSEVNDAVASKMKPGYWKYLKNG